MTEHTLDLHQLNIHQHLKFESCTFQDELNQEGIPELANNSK